MLNASAGMPRNEQTRRFVMVDQVLWRLRYQNLLGPGRSHDSITPRVGSAVALPCHMVRGVEGIGACLPGASGGKTRGVDAGNHD